MAKNSIPLTLGVEARDKITGFTGIVTSKIDYLTRCTQWALTPKAREDDSKLQDSHWFDTERMEVIGVGISVEFGFAEIKSTGGDIEPPSLDSKVY